VRYVSTLCCKGSCAFVESSLALFCSESSPTVIGFCKSRNRSTA